MEEGSSKPSVEKAASMVVAVRKTVRVSETCDFIPDADIDADSSGTCVADLPPRKPV
jgi:hypothetical protein